MLYAFLAVLCYSATRPTVVTSKLCEPSNYICAGRCPLLPRGAELQSVPICMKDTRSEGCVCWLNNPSSQLDTLFQCDAKINGSRSQILCQTPSHCFPPGPEPGCLVIPHCQCLFHNPGSESVVFGQWRVVIATVHIVDKSNPHDYEGNFLDKVQGDVREFSLKHLLFLLGFVIAPLLCWCILNFFHEGKCRKKRSQPPETQPIPTARGSTVDNMNNNDDGELGTSGSVLSQSQACTASIRLPRLPVILPSAPDELDVVVCAGSQDETHTKFESPPPYCESTDRNCISDCGPPPSYEDALLGSDAHVQQVWQCAYIIQPAPRESA